VFFFQSHVSQCILAHGTLKAREFTKKPLPVQVKSNTKLMPAFFYISCTLHVINRGSRGGVVVKALR
jgi:hypothetical protein